MIQSTTEVDTQINQIPQRPNSASEAVLQPLFNNIIFDNNSSEARDHCANERTFLSYLRLGAYMSVTSIAIVFSFSFDNPHPHYKTLSTTKYLAIAFWCLSIICLGLGVWTYFKTLIKFSLQKPIVKSSWVTHLVCRTFPATKLVDGQGLLFQS
ncbi:hypothetical protein OnM2_021087 [Erysiphe neolycopersici]|uniref:DUF202 domain-containing protein n=1 Tax=Erysiphe neolycopersici TaxID=212602 RepID=A0A420I343_9PEZI|nr:hypothetical protein OnM2_021087 [Erysiphe neolycopersici]